MTAFSGAGRRERYDHDRNARRKERGEQLVDGPRAAHRRDEVLPDEDHRAASDHARERALLVRALPEEREGASRGRTPRQSPPRERNDTEHGAVGVPGKHHADDGDADDRGARGQHRRTLVHLDTERMLHEVL